MKLKLPFKFKSSAKVKRFYKKLLIPFVIGSLVIFIPVLWLSRQNATKKVDAAFMKLDEGYGTSTKTNTANLSGTISGADWANSEMCVSGNCMYFNGSTDYVSFGDNSLFDFTHDQSFTISLWFKTPNVTSGYQVLLSKTNYTDGYALVMDGSTGTLIFALYQDLTGIPSDTVQSTVAYDDNNWHHVAISKTEATRMDMYIDGKLVNSDTSLFSVGDFSSTTPLILGAYGDTTSFMYKGYIDEVNIYPGVAKSESDIKSNAIINATDSGSSVQFGAENSTLSSGLVGYWKMDEYSAGTGAVTRNDSTPAAHNLTDASPYAPSATARNGRGVSFTQANSEYLTATDASLPELDVLTGLTISTWIYPTAQTGEGMIIGKDASNGNFSFRLTKYGDERIIFAFSENGYYYGEGDIWSDTGVTTANTWQLLSVTYDGQYFRLYLNDNEVTSGEFPYYYPGISIADTTANLTFGGGIFNGSGIYYNGYMDDTRIYSRGLTAAEIKKLYNYESGPDAYFDFNENTGGTTYDKGPFKISGALGAGSAAPKWVTGKFGSALESDGVDDTVQFDHATYWDYYTTDNISWEGWIKLTGPTGSSGGYLVGDGGGPLVFLDRTTDTTYQICWFTSSPVCSDVLTFAYNQWYYVAVVKQGTSNLSFYRDGVLINTDVPSEGNDDESTMEIFSGAASWKFKGAMDEIRFYRSTRTQEQIVKDMNAGHPTPGSPIGSSTGYWTFDEGYGDTAFNKGNGGHASDGNLAGSGDCSAGANSACPTWSSSGKFGKALSFDGGDYVDTSDTLYDTEDWTISAWVKRNTGASSMSIVSKRGVDGSGGFSLSTGMSGEIYCQTDNGVSVTSSYTTTGILPDSSDWVHLVAVRSGSSCKVYVNGSDRTTTIANHSVQATNNLTLRIGANAQDQDFFNGLIDEVYVYSSALDSDQIKTLYNHGKSINVGSTSTSATGVADNSYDREHCPPGNTEGNCAVGQDPSPIASFTFNEKNITTANDVSGNNNNGTVNGTVVAGQFEPGIKGPGLLLDGTADYVAADTVMDALVGANFTVSGWFKTTYSGAAAPEIWSMNTSSCGNRLLIYVDSDGTITTNSSNGTYGGTAVINDGNWHHLEVVFSDTGNYVTAYVDGVLDFTFTATFSILADEFFSLGQEYDSTPSCPTASNFFPGSLDEFVIYPYVRTNEQIMWDYSKGEPFYWYKLDECQNAVAYDSSRHRNNGTITAGDTSGDNDSVGTCASASSTEMWGEGAIGKIGGSLAFDGTNDYASFGDMTVLEGAQKVTWAFWIKPGTLSTSRCIFCKIDIVPSTVNAWAITTGASTASQLGISIPTNATDAFTSGTLPAGTLESGVWKHIAIVYDGTQSTNAGKLKAYVNGKETSLSFLGTLPGSLIASAIPVTLGGANDLGANFAGSIDDVRVYTNVLTPTQIFELYNLGSSLRFD